MRKTLALVLTFADAFCHACRSPPESKLVSLPRSISFRELQSKLTGGPPQTPPTIKYQLPGDVCILSVSSDDDLALMLEEYDSLLVRLPRWGPRWSRWKFRAATPPVRNSRMWLGCGPAGRVCVVRALISRPKGI